MPSSFTPLLKLELPATGELSGTWGTTVNNAITTPLSEAIAGTTTITVGGSDYTLSNGDGSAANEARKMFIVATGTPGASRNVICPAASKFYVFRNDTNQTLTLKTLSGTGIAVPAGQYRFLYCDGTNVVETFNAMASLTLGTALGTASGGTGLNSFTANRVFYASSTSAIAQSANLTFNGTTLVANDFTDSSLTATRVTYAGAGGNLTDSANLTFDGTSLTLGGNPTLSAGTANGVLYLNGSKVATSGSALTFDGTTLTLSSSPTLSGGTVNTIPYLNASKSLVSGSALGFNGSQMDIGVGVYYGRLNVGRDSSAPYATLMMGDQATPTNTVGMYMRQTSGAAGISTAGADFAFFLGGPGVSEGMRLTSTGLGIGGTPTQKLDVFGDIQQQNANYLRGRLAAGTVTRLFGLNSANSLYIGGIDASQSEMLFVRGGATQMVLDSSGSLLIGSSISSSTVGFGAGLLQVSSNSFAAGQIYTHNGTTGNTSAIELSRSRGTKAAPTIVTDGSDLGAIFFNGYDGVNYRPAAHIYCYVDGTPGASVMPGALVFSTTRPGNAGPTESMRIDSSGNLGLGVTPSAWGFGGNLELPATNNISFQGAYGNINSNAYYDLSQTRWEYITSGYAAQYQIGSAGQHIWNTAPSGTAGNAISFTQAMTLDAPVTPRLLIGTTTAGVGNNNNTNLTVAGGATVYQSLIASGSQEIYLIAQSGLVGLYARTNDPMLFGTNNQERARITSGGYFKASDDGTYTSSGNFHEVCQSANNVGFSVECSNASLTTLGCAYIQAERNTTNNTFYALSYYNVGAAAYKFRVADSGDVTNTNGTYGQISDAKLKTDIVDASSQWEDIKAVRFRKFRMKNDPSGVRQLGVVAQELEQVSPGLVDEHADRDAKGNDLGTTTKTVKTSVLLMKAAVALQEAMLRIEALEAKVAALETH